ncbi:MAG: CxxxxCH/CxxCH domain-containing protein, partial [Nitrospiraceae bacterium]|nr:CxxxxCH/CxxCH domain-containing protein [Nitrospiraceae bacterium]
MARRLSIIIAIAALLIPALGGANDAPHTNVPGYDKTCGNCHWINSATTAPWTSISYSPSAADDTINNRRCWVCHVGGSAPVAMTHSTTSTGSTKWPGSGWTTECVTCHNPHQQRQTRAYGSASYAYFGPPPVSIAAPTGGPSTINLSASLPTTTNYFGYYFMPDRNYPYFYRIESDTTTNTNVVTVKGQVNTAFVDTGGYAIVYGKNINEVISYINPGNVTVGNTVKLFRPVGTNGLVDSANLSTSVCYVCHTQTSHYNSTGSGDIAHNTGKDCATCHTHAEGFKGSGCDGCHGYPPNSAATMAYGSANGNDPLKQTGSTNPGAHSTHVSKGLTCANCHQGGMLSNVVEDKTIEIGFNLGTTSFSTANYTQMAPYSNGYVLGGVNGAGGGIAGQCSNVYCHGATMQTNGGSNTTPTWNVASTGACGTCHGADAANPPQLGSHVKHTGSAAGYSFSCILCHNTVAGQHVNGTVDWAFSTADSRTNGGKYNNAASGSTTNAAPSVTYQSCSNLYCHSSGQAADGGNTGPVYQIATWGGTVVCGNCHATTTGAPLGEIATGSHTNHLASTVICESCHTGAGTGTAYSSTNHVNGLIDVAAGLTYSAAGAPGNGYGNCSTASCHANVYGTGYTTTPVWGTAAGCVACHTAPNTLTATGPATGSHASHAVTDCGQCHATATNNTTAPTSNHANGVVDVADGYPSPVTKHTSGSYTGTCSTASCHSNVYGTGTITTPVWGTAAGCAACHTAPNTLTVTGPATGSHASHAVTDCGQCHATATNNTTAPTSNHANGVVDVADGYPSP